MALLDGVRACLKLTMAGPMSLRNLLAGMIGVVALEDEPVLIDALVEWLMPPGLVARPKAEQLAVGTALLHRLKVKSLEVV